MIRDSGGSGGTGQKVFSEQSERELPVGRRRALDRKERDDGETGREKASVHAQEFHT